MTKHTPGPWRVQYGTRLEIHGPRDNYGWPAHVVYNAGMVRDETALANARLIAAAPELVDMVRDLLATRALNLDDQDPDDVATCDRARVLLARLGG